MACSKCGGTDDHRFNEETVAKMKSLGYCFKCLHVHEWMQRRAWGHPAHGTMFVIGHELYTVMPEPQPGEPLNWRGYGGAKFTIRRITSTGVVYGDSIVTHNLWCQGDVPGAWREELPNTAVFITEE